MGTFGFSQVMLFWFVVSLLPFFIVELLKYFFNKSFCLPVRQITVTATQRADELVMRKHTVQMHWDFQAYNFMRHPAREPLWRQTLGMAGTNIVEATASLTILQSYLNYLWRTDKTNFCSSRWHLYFKLQNTRLQNLIVLSFRKTYSYYNKNVIL